MVTKFARKELARLGCTDEEIELILEYQKRFPILLDNEENMETFCIDARQLWNELGCPQGIFTNWVKRKFESYGFVENVDFTAFSQNVLKPQGGRPSTEYTLTIDMAKQLAMIDKKEAGFI